MKQYTKHYRSTTTNVNRGTNCNPSEVYEKPSATAPASFVPAGTWYLNKHSHSNTPKSPEFPSAFDDFSQFLDRCFKEYEQWILTTELRHAQLAMKYRSKFTLTHFPTTDPVSPTTTTELVTTDPDTHHRGKA